MMVSPESVARHLQRLDSLDKIRVVFEIASLEEPRDAVEATLQYCLHAVEAVSRESWAESGT